MADSTDGREKGLNLRGSRDYPLQFADESKLSFSSSTSISKSTMKWTIKEHNTLDKRFLIKSPPEFDADLVVDYDDVDHEVVDMVTQEMVRVLNEHFDFERFNEKLDKFFEERNLRYEKEEEEYWEKIEEEN